jgi:hypothetical protein
MTRLVQVAVAGDVSEAEEIEGMLAAAGIDATLETSIDPEVGEAAPEHVKVLVPEASVESAREAIESFSDESDDDYVA